MIRARRLAAASVTAALTLALTVAGSVSAQAYAPDRSPGHSHSQTQLAPRTHFTMAADGSSGRTQGGEGIPNIDIVKKTIATYYGDPGTGIADKTRSPYISEMDRITANLERKLPQYLREAKRHHRTPAIVVDTDDTMLFTYDMEAGDMHFVFDPAEQDVWVQDERFPATPGMVDLVDRAQKMGFAVIGITGRSDAQKAASIANVTKVGYRGFTAANYYTKWPTGAQPSYIRCATATCTTVEFKAGTRRHLERDLGYDIAVNIGDQWSDLQGGYANHTVKLPNPTYYLPSPNLPGVHEPRLTPRTHFEMAADGSSGLTQGGEGIPNIDVVKKTIATYYGDPGTGIADKDHSPYISEMRALLRRQVPQIAAQCAQVKHRHQNPAIVLDADDTTLFTYDMEVADMHFVFDPAEQDVWVQDERFPATPGMVSATTLLRRAGCTLIGLTGRNDDQKTATIGNLAKVGYTGFTAADYYTKWTGVGDSQQPTYIHCAAAKCTTIEYKSQTRAHVETRSGGGYRIVANFGDQYSDLIGGHADRVVKLPNPTYYLP
ncbi:HAD family acid phosphatase [Microbacterium luticocti]|uniref:HAD family acid phosphatase n=1 Tax=Microbacterium luticocti TaxID=451764 RepID=UPI0003FD5BC9|nr:HAD family acid phosphatase [Microbacterium luticocti]